jgi:hypothetical protein
LDRLFASPEPLDASVDRILACDDRYPAPAAETSSGAFPLEVWRHEKRLLARERSGGRG